MRGRGSRRRSAPATCARSRRRSFDALPAQTYVKGFLRTYADYLGLDGQLYVDEFNSRFGADGDEPREPVVPRRTSNVHRQHRRLERRWIAFALTGIAALVVVFIAAWKSGSPDERCRTWRRPPRRRREGAAGRHADAACADEARHLRLYVRATGGNCVEVRNWSGGGKTRFAGTVESGQSQRFVAPAALGQLGTPANLAIASTADAVRRADSPASPSSPRTASRERTMPPARLVVVTGSELVRGDIRDVNGGFLASEVPARLRPGTDRRRR